MPACRTCHIVRGTVAQSNIDFDALAAFQAYADRVKALVVDRGNMPLAKLVYDRFHASSGPELMATFLGSQGINARDASGAPLRPGRPVADPGPNRAIPPGATALSAANSLFSSTYPVVHRLGRCRRRASPSPNSAQTTFTAGNARDLRRSSSSRATAASRARPRCSRSSSRTRCRSRRRRSDFPTSAPPCRAGPAAARRRRLSRERRRGADRLRRTSTATATAQLDAADMLWLYTEVRGRINFTEIAASPLLRKPSGQHHNGGVRSIVRQRALLPATLSATGYDLFLNWILNNAPQ